VLGKSEKFCPDTYGVFLSSSYKERRMAYAPKRRTGSNLPTTKIMSMESGNTPQF